ncbi:MAG: hypothetical protein RH942_15060 [Kiloniellaceae bacterium]
MKQTEIVFLFVVCAAAVALCLHGWLVVGQGPIVILPPALIALALVVLSAVRVFRTLKITESTAEGALQLAYWQALRGSFLGLLWCLSAAPLLLLLGYPIGLAVFAAVYTRVNGAGAFAAVLTGGLAFAVVWVVAGKLLAVPLVLLPGWLS